MLRSTFVFLFIALFTSIYGQPPQRVIDYVIHEVNVVRAKGIKCGSKRMKPVNPVKWNDKLHYSATNHAKEMDRYNYFGHISIKGLDVGDKLDQVGYTWQHAGENLGEGQDTFDEVFQDWLESPGHCRTIMDPNMKEMGLAKIGKYWVQHFGRKMPPDHKRVNRRYIEN